MLNKAEKLVILISLAVTMSLLGFLAVLALNGDSIFAYVNTTCNVSACVALKGNHADPDSVHITIGETVQFNSADGKKHDITIGEGGAHHEHTEGGFETGVFGAREGYRATFNQAGTYELHDHENPSIHFGVLVEDTVKE